MGRGGAPAKGGVAPAAKVAVTGKVGCDGIPDVSVKIPVVGTADEGPGGGAPGVTAPGELAVGVPEGLDWLEEAVEAPEDVGLDAVPEEPEAGAVACRLACSICACLWSRA